MLQLSDQDFKITILTMFFEVKENMLIMWENIGSINRK